MRRKASSPCPHGRAKRHNTLSDKRLAAVRPLHCFVALLLCCCAAQPLRCSVAPSRLRSTAPNLDRSQTRPLPNSTTPKIDHYQTRPLPNATTPIQTTLAALQTSHSRACLSYAGRLRSAATALAPKASYSHVQRDLVAVYRPTHR
ncbi:hypothetical protein RhiLY_13226 [Ceratobasidium sp. AG-Ba]|nr:hypothetical protein RhiLY_13226 [Ceratobasidium sp. AG-Ba]